MSGQTRRPWTSVSSPTLAMTVSSTSGSIANPCASFVPPVPPARSVTFIRVSDAESGSRLG